MTIKELNEKVFRSLPVVKYLLPYSTYRSIAKQTASDLDSLFFYCIDLFGVEAVIECGANEASASVKANQRGLKALAIEANPSTFSAVTPDNSDLFEKFNCGLSDEQSIQNFYIPKSNHIAGSSTFYPKAGEAYSTIEVPTYTLDSVLSNHQITERSYALWIDVEGMQKQVLGGALETLSNPGCLIVKCEVEDSELFKNQDWLSEDVCRHFSELGFDVIFRDFEYPCQYNILFVKKPVPRSLYETRDGLIFKTWGEVKNSAHFFALKIRLRAEFRNFLKDRVRKHGAAD